MHPIPSPYETMDSTIGSDAVTRGQIEGSALERVGLTHHDLIIRITVVLLRGEGDVAINTREVRELIPVADDLFRFAAGILHRFSDHPRAVIAERDPPQ